MATDILAEQNVYSDNSEKSFKSRLQALREKASKLAATQPEEDFAESEAISFPNYTRWDRWNR